ncbi:hypothetical protein [Neorhizobium sp. LjRoot104]|uniref:hypothetical protein n=1 Tax=Neorhizobium sp. LjRoot104 TaxID=3342254 RepID=UPI003ECD8BE5
MRGTAPPWTHAEVEAATRIVRLVLEQRNNHRMRELSLRENESLLGQKDYLRKEVNHRV